MFYVKTQTLLQAQRAQDPQGENLVFYVNENLNISRIQWDRDLALLLTDHLAEKSDHCTSFGQM